MPIKMSEQTKELFTAMSAFQKDVKQPKKDANNPFFKSKYVPLENVVDAIHTIGSQHGLSEMTYPAVSENGTEFGVGVIITHSSGQFIQFPPITLKPDKNTPQGVGSAMTYARRYALSSAFGIASETDDDGNDISGNGSEKPAKKITAAQAKVLESLVEKVSKASNGVAKKEALMTKLKVNDFTVLTVDEYGNILNQLNAWKQAYEKKAKENKVSEAPKKEAPQQVEQESILDRYGNPK